MGKQNNESTNLGLVCWSWKCLRHLSAEDGKSFSAIQVGIFYRRKYVLIEVITIHIVIVDSFSSFMDTLGFS